MFHVFSCFILVMFVLSLVCSHVSLSYCVSPVFYCLPCLCVFKSVSFPSQSFPLCERSSISVCSFVVRRPIFLLRPLPEPADLDTSACTVWTTFAPTSASLQPVNWFSCLSLYCESTLLSLILCNECDWSKQSKNEHFTLKKIGSITIVITPLVVLHGCRGPWGYNESNSADICKFVWILHTFHWSQNVEC